MDTSNTQERIDLLRWNLENSATPNMELAIENSAPIAALVYALAYIDTLAGFFYGIEAKKEASKQKRRGEVRIRYTRFIDQYLSPAKSGVCYRGLDLYVSMRCNMLHNLMSGHYKKGTYVYYLVEEEGQMHGTQATDGMILFDVPTFCDDVLNAAEEYLNDVEQALSKKPEAPTLTGFNGWWDKEYSVLVST